MSDLVTIYNRALALAGARRQLSTPDQQGSEGDQCRLWYPIVRDTVQRSANWPSCKRYSRLAVLGERANFNTDWAETNPSPGYRYAYAAPADMLAPRYLHTYQRFELEVWEPTNVMAVMTNVEDAILHYTTRQDNIQLWDTDLQNAIIYTLAATIAMPLVGKVAATERLRERAVELVINAQTNIANSADDVEEALPGFVTARGYTDRPHTSLYFYPSVDFNGVIA